MLREGHRAWRRGEIERALAQLEPALARRPGSPDALYPLARALSERGEPERALALLEEALAAVETPAPEARRGVARLFRALVFYDHGRMQEALEELSRVGPGNLIARALRALIRFREPADPREITIPRGARWVADVGGRLLAVLEGRLHRLDPSAALDFHHPLFASGSGPARRGPADEIEEAFAAKDYPKVAAIQAREVDRLGSPSSAPSSASRSAPKRAAGSASPSPYTAFALMALGKDERAARLLADALRASPSSADLHFLEGLCHVRCGRLGGAGWSFARAARLADVDVDQVLGDVARKLGVRMDLED